jgi:tRNA 2-selenouridine synthase
MPVEKTDIEPFLRFAGSFPVLDVRSPAEYRHAHIPGAYNLPLFTDEERKVVGTTYKQVSREAAVKTGLDFFGPKMRRMVEEVEALVGSPEPGAGIPGSKTVLVHCWRGGMRSAGVAWLLDLYGFKVYTLSGGYKKFRHYVLDSLAQPRQFNIVGGYTGSGKTELLYQLAEKGLAVIDLEGLANHKGSAFGNLGMPPQPSQEQFENRLAIALASCPVAAPVWLEDESQRIGDINLPQPLWQMMRRAPVYFLDIPFEERLKHIVGWYGLQDKERIVNSIIRIKKRLGGLETKTAVNFLIEDDVEGCFRVLLKYYDKWYTKSLAARDNPGDTVIKIPGATVDASANAALVLKQQFEKKETTVL